MAHEQRASRLHHLWRRRLLPYMLITHALPPTSLLLGLQKLEQVLRDGVSGGGGSLSHTNCCLHFRGCVQHPPIFFLFSTVFFSSLGELGMAQQIRAESDAATGG